MLTPLSSIILGIIQGITEWLPVSSSGHLVIAQHFFNIQEPLSFDVLLHFGTVLVVLAVFWKDILLILKALFKLDFKSEYGKLLTYIILGTIPIGLVGYFFQDTIKTLFENIFTTAIALLVTGTLLFLTKFSRPKKDLTLKNTFIVGLAQVIALVPGISRSGITISTSLFQNIEQEKAARFSFLLSVPAILGATVLEFKDILTAPDLGIMFYGLIASVIFGYIALKLLLKIIIQRKFHYFSYYCWIVGIIVLILSI